MKSQKIIRLHFTHELQPHRSWGRYMIWWSDKELKKFFETIEMSVECSGQLNPLCVPQHSREAIKKRNEPPISSRRFRIACMLCIHEVAQKFDQMTFALFRRWRRRSFAIPKLYRIPWNSSTNVIFRRERNNNKQHQSHRGNASRCNLNKHLYILWWFWPLLPPS